MLQAVLVKVRPLPAYTVPLECNGNIISAGIPEQHQLDGCDEPTSRDGANWICLRPGFVTVVVAF
jgi:enoyl reductase-like protein